ncbi:unnamed protein product [Linum tenue]|uniref:histidinol-phosphatase n=1 Tax=Linum tenue TaxID=586396 RepID=A0AAV0GWY7_9ROSI|nr:unnamed protein product [Linum tenue]
MAEQKTKILIIGGTGYIGKYIVEASANAGHPTYALVRRSTLTSPTKSNTIDSFNKLGVKLLIGDLNDHENLVKAIKLVDVVISTVGQDQLADQNKIISAIKEAGNIKLLLHCSLAAASEPLRSLPPAAATTLSFPTLRLQPRFPLSLNRQIHRASASQLPDDGSFLSSTELDGFADIAGKLADASGEVIRKYFRKKFEILDKDDLSPVTIADRAAEEAMISILLQHFPSHAIYGEENGWQCKEENSSDFVWVLDPIDGTKSFITGKPLFGTLISLLFKGKPILGIIDQPILRERWIGMSGRRTTLDGEEISTRSCLQLSQAYLYTTSPHLFSGDAVEAFARVRDKVKVPLYGCDCYAYALLASGYVDLVVESGLKPYDFLALIPVIEGAGGIITDWKGCDLTWEASQDSKAPSFNVVAAGDRQIHQQALDALQWP